MNEVLPWCISGVLLLIIVVVVFAPKKSSGLSPEHHSELNEVLDRGSPRYDELRGEYAGDEAAQQQIDRYDRSSVCGGHIRALRDAYMSGDEAAVSREDQWFDDNA